MDLFEYMRQEKGYEKEVAERLHRLYGTYDVREKTGDE